MLSFLATIINRFSALVATVFFTGNALAVAAAFALVTVRFRVAIARLTARLIAICLGFIVLDSARTYCGADCWTYRRDGTLCNGCADSGNFAYRFSFFSRAALQAFLKNWRERLETLETRNVRWTLDVDPLEF